MFFNNICVFLSVLLSVSLTKRTHQSGRTTEIKSSETVSPNLPGHWPSEAKSEIDGSYRLRLPQVPLKVSSSEIILDLCNIHTFEVEKNPNWEKVKIELISSTERACEIDHDHFYIDLLESVDSFVNNGNWVQLLKNDETVAKLNRERIRSTLKGNWLLEIINVGLEVSNGTITFSGCNENSFSFNLNSKKQSIKIKFVGKTKKLCNFDNDKMFQTALKQSVKYEPGQVSFSLYNSRKSLLAEATPYLV